MIASPLSSFLTTPSRFLFFTGKGGVGKTSLACGTAIALADSGKRVLLVSTDPASNLDEVLATPLSNSPAPVSSVPLLDALNIDPEAAARAYRERIVGPIRGVLPDATVANIEEQLSGACTTEIASFNEFSNLLGDPSKVANYDHIILDTAPTGHTLRLLALPAAWTDFIADNKTGSTCLGPLSGLQDQQVIYQAALATLRDPSHTSLVLVARADTPSLAEAARASTELASLEIRQQVLILNALFSAPDSTDPLASALHQRTQNALTNIPAALAPLPQYHIPFRVNGLSGTDRLRSLFQNQDEPTPPSAQPTSLDAYPTFDTLVHDLAATGRGVIMTMGKGGVGKTTLATQIAFALAEAGHPVHLTTTDPANHLPSTADIPNLTLSSINPKQVTETHIADVLATTGKDLDPAARALLEEELRSPCTEEIAVFTAFAKEVAKGETQFVVLDTAPTGHTLLLLDATEAYHREVLKNAQALSPEVQSLLPRLRDPDYTRTLIVALPEATPIHEAAALQTDLRRAGIEPYAWILNQCIDPSTTTDPRLLAKATLEQTYLQEATTQHAPRLTLSPFNLQTQVGRGRRATPSPTKITTQPTPSL